MIRIRLFAAAVILSAVTIAPTLAQARHHHRHHAYRDYNYGLPYPISYLHNYVPGVEAGTFACRWAGRRLDLARRVDDRLL